jgi:hypothetical protein
MNPDSPAALFTVLVLSFAAPAFAEKPASGVDLTGKTVYLLPNSWLRYGPSLLSKLYTVSTPALELKGRGTCTTFACPVSYNGVDLFARRSKLDLAKPAGPVATDRTLRVGDEGEDVRVLHTALNKKGFSLTIDGTFGKTTESAVKELQKKSGLETDGVVGPTTRDLLKV